MAKPASPVTARLRVGFILANNFTLTAFATFIDTLRLAADEGDRSRPILCQWTVMSATGKPVRSSAGIDVLPQADLLPPRQFDYIAVIGGLLHKGTQVDAATDAYLRQAAAAGVPLIGVCTGSFVLARAGLMAGRRCCVSWYHHRDLLDEFDSIEPISDRIFFDDRDRITCSGGAGAADLAAMLVDRHIGQASARKSLNVLLFDAPRPASSAQPAPSHVLQGASERVRRASLMMEQRLADPLPIEVIARRLDMSVRQLDRLFQAELGLGPAAIYRAMRVENGRWMLQGTERPIADVASLTCFADGAHFSRAFRKQFGVSPSQWRKATGTAGLATSERRIY